MHQRVHVQNRPLTRRRTALVVYVLLVLTVVMCLLNSCYESVALQWIRFEQQKVLRQLPRHPVLLKVVAMTEWKFRQVRMLKAGECMLEGKYYEIVSLVHTPQGVVLTLLPDPKETALRNGMAQKIADKTPCRRAKTVPMPGFLFFENCEMPSNLRWLETQHQPVAYLRFVGERFLPIDLPPPRTVSVHLGLATG